MSAQFTPGPWNEDGPIIYTGINQRTGKIAEVSLAYKSSATYAANAHLIAAAPKLHAAAQAAFDFLGGIDDAAEVRDQLVEALIDAEGGLA